MVLRRREALRQIETASCNPSSTQACHLQCAGLLTASCQNSKVINVVLSFSICKCRGSNMPTSAIPGARMILVLLGKESIIVLRYNLRRVMIGRFGCNFPVSGRLSGSSPLVMGWIYLSGKWPPDLACQMHLT